MNNLNLLLLLSLSVCKHTAGSAGWQAWKRAKPREVCGESESWESLSIETRAPDSPTTTTNVVEWGWKIVLWVEKCVSKGVKVRRHEGREGESVCVWVCLYLYTLYISVFEISAHSQGSNWIVPLCPIRLQSTPKGYIEIEMTFLFRTHTHPLDAGAGWFRVRCRILLAPGLFDEDDQKVFVCHLVPPPTPSLKPFANIVASNFTFVQHVPFRNFSFFRRGLYLGQNAGKTTSPRLTGRESSVIIFPKSRANESNIFMNVFPLETFPKQGAKIIGNFY